MIRKLVVSACWCVTGMVPMSAGAVTVTLTPDALCYEVGAEVVVNVNMTDASEAIIGGQFFMMYDTTALDFISAEPGDDPFLISLFLAVDEVAGTIDFAVGVPNIGVGTMEDATMARFTFIALASACETEQLVKFRPHVPPTRLTTEASDDIIPVLNALSAITISGVGCPNCSLNVACTNDSSQYLIIARERINGNVDVVTSNFELGSNRAPVPSTSSFLDGGGSGE